MTLVSAIKLDDKEVNIWSDVFCYEAASVGEVGQIEILFEKREVGQFVYNFLLMCRSSIIY